MIKPKLTRAMKANAMAQREQRREWRRLWLADHPGRTSVEYTRIQNSEEVWEWRGAHNRAAIAAEEVAWLADHPGRQFPEHECSLSEAEYAEYARWLAEYEGRLLPPKLTKSTKPHRQRKKAL